MLTLLLAFSLSAAGDAIYVMQGPDITLDTATKFDLANAVASTFPGVPQARIDEYVCHATNELPKDRTSVNLAEYASSLPWICHVIDNNAGLTDAQLLNCELNPDLHCSPDGSFAMLEMFEMSDDAKVLNGAFTSAAFGKSLSYTWWYRCKRFGDDIVCPNRYVKIASPSTYKIDKELSSFVLLIGKVGQ